MEYKRGLPRIKFGNRSPLPLYRGMGEGFFGKWK
jgi:hypothetical protein